MARLRFVRLGQFLVA